MENNAHKNRQLSLLCSVTALVLAIAIVITAALKLVPKGYLEFDISSNNLYDITSATESLLDGLQYDVKIAVISQKDTLDRSFLKFMDRYSRLSDKVEIIYEDPVKTPSVLETYNTEADTMVISCEETGRSVTLNIFGFQGYSEGTILYDYMTYMMSGTLSMVSFDVEGQLASAINYVTGTEVKNVYCLSGHGELQMSQTIGELMEKSNYDVKYLDLLLNGSVPEDCDLLICYCPENDMSADEYDTLSRWLSDGGKMMLVLDVPELSNFSSLLQTYGIQMESGMLADLSNYYSNYFNSYGYYCIAPVMNTDSDVIYDISSNAMVLYARPMTLTSPDRANSIATPFLATSQSGVNYIDENNREQGQYYVGITATEELDEEKETRLTVFSSQYFVADQVLSTYSGISNAGIFMNAVNANFSDMDAFAIPAKNTVIQYNAFTDTTLWSVFFVGIVPAAFLIGGLVIWNRRRKS